MNTNLNANSPTREAKPARLPKTWPHLIRNGDVAVKIYKDQGKVRGESFPTFLLIKLFASDRHPRPLLKLNDDEQGAAIELARRWVGWADTAELSPKMMEAAVIFLHPPEAPVEKKESIAAQWAERFRNLVQEEKAHLPQKTSAVILQVFENLAKRAAALGGPRRSTGID